MRFHIHTYGCQMNVRDSEAAAALLIAAGHTPVAHEADADLIIVNTCSVRGKAEDKALGKLGLLCASKKRGRPDLLVGVMGCMVQRLGNKIFKRIRKLDFAVGTRRAGAIPHVVTRVLAGEHGILESSDPDEEPDVIDAHTESGVTAFVTILLGCNRRCSYCIVPDVRGPEYSRPAREILAEIRLLIQNGVREITLLGQSVMNYGRTNPVWQADDPPSAGDFREPFARLLEAVAALPGIQRIRYTSAHPSGVTLELVHVVASTPQICHHLHLPVQSGSDRILKLMRRGYTRSDYLQTISQLRKAMPDFAITSDVIVGFPGETEEDFKATRSLMHEVRFDNIFIFKYSPRPGTPAADMPDDVSDEDKRRRNQVLLADQDLHGKDINTKLVGSIQQVLAEGPSLRCAARWAGRSPGNKIVVFDPVPGIEAGSLVSVRITRAAPQTLYGELLA